MKLYKISVTPYTEDLGCDTLLRRMWRLYRKPRNKVARVSEERDYELHRHNTTDNILATRQTKQMKEEGRPVRTSRWLAGEDRIVIKNLRNYRKDYPDYDPLEILHSNLRLDPKLKRIVKTTNFYSRIAEGLNRTVHAVFYRLKYVLFPGKDIKKGKYLFEESVQLQKLYKLYGPNWTKIGAHLGRSDRSVAVKWSFSQKTKTGRWNEAEDAVLLEAVLKFKETNQTCMILKNGLKLLKLYQEEILTSAELTGCLN